MVEELTMPGPLDLTLSDDRLIEALLVAHGWMSGACSHKQDRAWTKRHEELRAEALRRMKKD